MNTSPSNNSSRTPALDRFLNRLQERPTRQSLQPVKTRIDELPDLAATVVQVVGSNGKGSTLHAAEQALVSLGRTTVSCSSPHLTGPTERLRLNSKPVSEDLLEQRLAELNECQETCDFTPFEKIFLISVQEALDRKVDYLLLEAGMGGRWDATSAVEADWTICTGVELEHTDYLGETRREILGEMTAQVPRRSNLVTVDLNDGLNQYLSRLARRRDLKLTRVDNCEPVFDSQKSLVAEVLIEAENLPESTAAELLEDVVPPEGRGTCRHHDQRTYYFDVAHTPAAVENSFRKRPELETGEWYVAYGSLGGKRTGKILEVIENQTESGNILLTAPPSPRAVPADRLCSQLTGRGGELLELPRVKPHFLDRSRPGDGLMVVGSFSLVGWFLKQ